MDSTTIMSFIFGGGFIATATFFLTWRAIKRKACAGATSVEIDNDGKRDKLLNEAINTLKATYEEALQNKDEIIKDHELLNEKVNNLNSESVKKLTADVENLAAVVKKQNAEIERLNEVVKNLNKALDAQGRIIRKAINCPYPATTRDCPVMKEYGESDVNTYESKQSKL